MILSVIHSFACNRQVGFGTFQDQFTMWRAFRTFRDQLQVVA